MAKRYSAIGFDLVLLYVRQDLHVGHHDLALLVRPGTKAADADPQDI